MPSNPSRTSLSELSGLAAAVRLAAARGTTRATGQALRAARLGTERAVAARTAGATRLRAGHGRSLLPRALALGLGHGLRPVGPGVDLYAVFRGPHRYKATSSVAAGTLLLGVMLAAAPGSAVAQTVRPTTPGTSAFTAARGVAPVDNLVQVADPTAYRLTGGAHASQDAVALAGNLTPHTEPAPAEAPAATQPAAPQPAPAPPAPPAPAPAAEPGWSAPAPGAPISNPYGKPDSGYAAGYHTGVDFAVDSGTPLLAVGDGTVVSAAYDGAYGKEIVLRLTDGHFAQYAHMSRLDVHASDHVSGGQELGASGTTGNSTGPHLHFEIRTSNSYGRVIDPIGYLAAHGVTDF